MRKRKRRGRCLLYVGKEDGGEEEEKREGGIKEKKERRRSRRGGKIVDGKRELRKEVLLKSVSVLLFFCWTRRKRLGGPGIIYKRIQC